MTTTHHLAFEIALPLALEDAVSQATAALKEEGFGILTRIDVHTTLREKLGATIRPYVILGACNPLLAYRALTHEAQAGLLLPCNVTVEETSPRQSMIRVADPRAVLAVGGLERDPTLRAIAEEARAKLERAAEALKRR